MGVMELISPEVVEAALQTLHAQIKPISDGRVWDHIPELGSADPGCFGMALVGMSGRRYHAGDAMETLTMQSVSKPFVYALVLARLGAETVDRWVRAEPSGDAF